MLPIFAITTRGLEDVSAAEMAGLAGMGPVRCAYRRVEAEFNGEAGALLDLRTVDDVFVRLAVWNDTPPQRSALAQMRLWCRELPLRPAVGRMAELRRLPARPSFSLTVNFVGKRNYTAEEVKAALASEIEEQHGWRYGGENETDLNLRVFIEHEQAHVGLRLSTHPLHSRVYKQAHLSGSLKPTVAAGMLRLTGAWPGGLMVDPFCGAGTIAVEAALIGLRAWGGDLDAMALSAAAQNAHSAGVPVGLTRLDARRLPFDKGGVDFVLSNLPWGRQVQVDEPLKDLYGTVCAEIERVLVRDGQAALLTSLPDMVHFRRLSINRQIEISLFGQNPSILLISA
jgi:23S rRNA G2445 N2-methylase RlmL